MCVRCPRGRRGVRWRGRRSATALRGRRIARGGRPAPASGRPCEEACQRWEHQTGLANRGSEGGGRQLLVGRRYLEAMTKRELEADADEACELPIAAGGGGSRLVGAGERARAQALSNCQSNTLRFFYFPFFLRDLLFQLFFSLCRLSSVVTRHWAAPRATKGTPDAFVWWAFRFLAFHI